MRKVLDLVIRIMGSMLAIHFINLVLLKLGMECYVGLNGYTLAMAAVFGLPGILGLYVIFYLL